MAEKIGGFWLKKWAFRKPLKDGAKKGYVDDHMISAVPRHRRNRASARAVSIAKWTLRRKFRRL